MSAPEDAAVAPLVRKSAAWSWRLLVILGAIVAGLWLFKQLEVILVPVAIAVIITALLLPWVDWLERRGLPRGFAVFLILLAAFAVLGGLLSFVVSQFIEGLPGLVAQVEQSIEQSRDWLIEGPLGMSREQIDNGMNSAIEALRNNQERLTSGALSTASTITEIVTGAFVALFTVIFLLYGGRNIYRFLTGVFPAHTLDKVRDAGRAGFKSLTGFVHATFLVALVDAVGIGAGLAIMGIPLAVPLASVVFLGAFIPLVGAVISGLLAVVVALLAKGFVYALLTLGLILAVQQLEGHVLQPLLMGRLVKIHPLAIVLGILTGAVLGGIVGALLAVPVIAFLNSAVRELLKNDEDVGEPEGGDVEVEEVAVASSGGSAAIESGTDANPEPRALEPGEENPA